MLKKNKNKKKKRFSSDLLSVFFNNVCLSSLSWYIWLAYKTMHLLNTWKILTHVETFLHIEISHDKHNIVNCLADRCIHNLYVSFFFSCLFHCFKHAVILNINSEFIFLCFVSFFFLFFLFFIICAAEFLNYFCKPYYTVRSTIECIASCKNVKKFYCLCIYIL